MSKLSDKSNLSRSCGSYCSPVWSVLRVSLSTCGSSYKSRDLLTNIVSNSPEAEASTSQKLNGQKFGTCIHYRLTASNNIPNTTI